MTGSDRGQSGVHHKKLKAAIFDVDGVLLASPHERAWREALAGFGDASRFTPRIYETQVSGKPRMAGALAALKAVGAPNAEGKAEAYAEKKQARLEELIADKEFSVFPDAMRFVQALADANWPMAAASSSKNANGMMKTITLPSGRSLLEIFTANVSGADLPRGKPDPAIFLLAAEALKLEPSVCFVAEDAPAGIEAAFRGGMAPLGIARGSDAQLLQGAGAELVVSSFDDVSIDALLQGHLARKAS